MSDIKSQLELEFEVLVKSHMDEIEVKVNEAAKALEEAIALSEKYSIPFHARISFLGNTYTPSSFPKGKFSKLNRDIVTDITGAWDDSNFQYGGWQHSAIC